MLTPEYLEKSPNKLSKLTLGFENEIFQDIAERIARMGKLSASSEWQLLRLLEIRQFDTNYRKRLQKLLNYSDVEMDRLFKDASEQAYVYDKRLFDKKGISFIPVEHNAFLQQLTLATAVQSKNTFDNITRTMGMIDEMGRHLPIRDYFIKTLDDSVMRVATGVQSYDESIKQAISKMVGNGITVVNYQSGRAERIEGVVRRNVLTSVGQMANNIADNNIEQLGAEYVEVSAHNGARTGEGVANHQAWQGKVYQLDGSSRKYPNFVESTGYGTGEGLGGWNCRHSFSAFFPEFSERRWTDEQLKEMNKEENKPIKYTWKDKRGVEHTNTFTYREALDKQRLRERQMRITRSKAKAFEKAGQEEEYQLQKGRYRSQLAEYKRFASAMDIDLQMQRVYIDGLGRI